VISPLVQLSRQILRRGRISTWLLQRLLSNEWRSSAFKEMQMKQAIYSCLPIMLVVTVPAHAQEAPPALVYAASGSCLNSPEGFNSKFEPANSGVAWTTTFNAIGSIDASGNVVEVGQSVDTASFGVGPRMHAPAASSYKVEFTSTVSSNSDGSYASVTGILRGSFTDGPLAGKTFTAAPGVVSKRWAGKNGVSMQVTAGSPIIQKFSVSNGVSYQRICTVRTSVTAAAH
jgi:hypothetical protein